MASQETTSAKAIFEKLDSSKLNELTVHPEAKESIDGGPGSGVGISTSLSNKVMATIPDSTRLGGQGMCT